MNGRKPTRQERRVINEAGYDTYKWLVQMNNNDYLRIVNRDTKEEVKIRKCGNQGWTD